MSRFKLSVIVMLAAAFASNLVAAESAQMVFQPDVYRTEHVLPTVWNPGDFRIVGASVRPVVAKRTVSVREWGEFYGRTRNKVESVEVVQVRVAFDGPPRRMHEYEDSVLTFNLPLEVFDASTLTQLRRGVAYAEAQRMFKLDIARRTEDRRVVDAAASDLREWDLAYRPRTQRVVYKTVPVDVTAVKINRQ